jgi:outer membrane protein assembly factor BamB
MKRAWCIGAVAAWAASVTLLCDPANARAGTPTLVWPKFRGPTGMGGASATNLPTTWGQKQNLVWKVELPGSGSSSPLLVGDRIYLTCFTGYGVRGQRGDMNDLRLHLLCLDRATGATRWTKDIMPKLPEQPTMRENHGYASHTPVADAERLYVFLGKTGVIAFDHDGKQLWQDDVGSGIGGFGSAAPLALHGDLLLVNASVESESLIALNKNTGKQVWRAPRIQESYNLPIVVKAGGREEAVVAAMGNVFAFDVKTGTPLWSCKTDIPWYMVPSMVTQGDMIYCIGGRGDTNGSMAIKAGGKGDVTASHRLWHIRGKGSNVTSPVLHEGHLYFMNDVLGIAYCLNAKSGDVVYQERVDGASQVYASPILAEGRIYYVSRDGRTAVVAAAPSYELLASNDLRDRTMFNASPAAADGRLYLRSEQYLYCVGK